LLDPGFTSLSRADYLAQRDQGTMKKDGCYVQFITPHGPLEENLRTLDRIAAQ
jgi:large subunit ribosomal protein L10e